MSKIFAFMDVTTEKSRIPSMGYRLRYHRQMTNWSDPALYLGLKAATMCELPEGQADAVRADMLGCLNVSNEGVESALAFMMHSGMVPWNSPRWEVIEFLRDILSHIRREPAIPGESREHSRPID